MKKLILVTVVILIIQNVYAQSFDWTDDIYHLTVIRSDGVIDQNWPKPAPHM